MKQFLDLLSHVMKNGSDRSDRTGIGVRSVFGYMTRYDLENSFPLVTTKKVPLKSIIYELLWFLSGNTNIQYLVKNGVPIWNEWAYQVYIEKNNLQEKFPRYSENWKDKMAEFVGQIKNDDDFALEWGDLGPVYGKQWTAWENKKGQVINQIEEVINLIKNDPYSKRILISGWNVGEIQELIRTPYSAPPPCHTLFQFRVHEGKLSCQLFQRSQDAFLGGPFNIASYSILTLMLAQVTGLKAQEFIHTYGDLHIYHNHFDQVKEQLTRTPRPLPTLKLNPEVKDIFKFKYEDFNLVGYAPHPAIKAPIAV